MQSIINSIVKNRNLIIYLFLSFISFNYLYNNSAIHYSGIGEIGTFISGSTSSIYSNINSYFNLKEENSKLIEENLELKKIESQLIGISNKSNISESKIDKTINEIAIDCLKLINAKKKLNGKTKEDNISVFDFEKVFEIM